jgi:hypothetical protein
MAVVTRVTSTGGGGDEGTTMAVAAVGPTWLGLLGMLMTIPMCINIHSYHCGIRHQQ